MSKQLFTGRPKVDRKARPTAAARYAVHKARIAAALEALTAMANEADPADLDWGHVGTVEEIADKLDAILTFAGREPTKPQPTDGTYAWTTLGNGRRAKVWIPG